MSGVLSWAPWVAFWTLILGAPYWRSTACTCGREKAPWFYTRHEKQWIMWLLALVTGVSAVGAALLYLQVFVVLNGLVTVWYARCAWEHGKGKRKWPKRLAGRVRINSHGRLEVVNQLSALNSAVLGRRATLVARRPLLTERNN